jgi:hypothetical protein
MADQLEFEIPISSTSLYIVAETDATHFEPMVLWSEIVPLTNVTITNTSQIKIIQKKPGVVKGK